MSLHRHTPRLGRLVIYTILILAAVFYLTPLYVIVITSIKSLQAIHLGNLLSIPLHPTLQPWREAWSSACSGATCQGVQVYFWNSVHLVIPAVLISTAFGAVNGYVLTQWRFRGSDLFFTLLLIGTFIPFQMVLLPMAWVLGKIHLQNSIAGLVMVHVIYGLAFTTLFFRNFYITIPRELVKAAMIDGAGFFTIFWRIMLPVSTPIFMVTIIWQFTQIWNDFLFGVVFTSGAIHPITVALNNLVNTSTGVRRYNVDMAAALIAALPTLLVYLIAGKYFVRGLTAGSVKG
ncbi:sugar ABC transporter permease [Acidihalobacter ferrooxydans]|uniref:Sugar ABC transporter permease n=2 Tax=Acidihalobacter ferrooxydans TaxID=1765967 RepID=A0A1P8ULQ3_9GAMM|nr:sugar ABC transporter permease [Acidihalobacter ferrooxydans]